MNEKNVAATVSATSPEPWANGLWLVLLITAALWFGTLGTRHLLGPDEGRYAEIPREMVVSGDWITPRLNGIKYFEKPALQYWLTAVAYQVFGQNEFTSRLWGGLTGFAGIVFAGFVGVRLFGRAAGIMAAAVTASSVLYVVIGHINTLDMGMSFFLQLTVCGFLLAQHAAEKSAAERNWMLAAWIGAALAFLSKGLIALVLPSLTLLAYTVSTRELSAWRRLHILKGLAIFLLCSAPWLIAVARANPEFARFFFWHEQFERFLVNGHDRDGPWWYFLPIFVVGSLPWTFVALRQLPNSWRLDQQRNGFYVRRFLVLWVGVVIVFFSISHSKLPPYIVPVVPMFALLLGDAFTRLEAAALRQHLLITGLSLVALAITVSLLPATIAGAKSIELVTDLKPGTALGLAIAAAALLLSHRLVRHYSVTIVVVTASMGMLLGMTVITQGSNALSATRSGYALAQQLIQQQAPLGAEAPLYSVSNYDQTLPFYLKRRMTLVNYRGELDFGLSQEPQLGIDSLDDFTRAWQAQTTAVAIMPEALYTQLLNQGVPMHLIAQQAKLIAVSRAPLPMKQHPLNNSVVNSP